MQGERARSRGQVDLTVGVVTSQPEAVGSPEGEGARQGGWAALVGEMKVTGSGPGGGDGEQLTVHPSVQGCVCAEVSQELVRGGKAFVTRPPGGHPVAGVRLGVIGKHEAIRVERVGEG